jgi:photosystem II stability/assembly factor-like uncharacterized protein
MHYLLHIFAGVAGALLLYSALFLYADENKLQQNRLEQIWQEIYALQERALSKKVAFLRVAASSTRTALDFILGKKLLSMRAGTITVLFSLASTLVWLVKSPQASLGIRSLMVLFCLLLQIMGSVPACAQSDLTSPSLQRSIVKWLYWFGVVVFAVVAQLFILYRLSLGTLDNELEPYFLVFAVLAHDHPFVVVLAFVLAELSILTALATDIFFLALFRWVIRRITELSQLWAIALYFLLAGTVGALLAGPAILLVVPSLLKRFLEFNPGFFAVAYFVFTSTWFDVGCLVIFVCYAIVLLLHRLAWPVSKGLFDYTAGRTGLIRKRKLRGGVGIMLLLYALPATRAPSLRELAQHAEQYVDLSPEYYGGTDFHGVFFLPHQSMRGWVVGEEGTILHTDDGGRTWMRDASGSGRFLVSVAFAGAQSGWAVGWYGFILHTEDGGHHWSAQLSENRETLNAAAFANEQEGWAVGKGGTILHTGDGGKRWSAQTSGTRQGLSSVTLASARSAWAVGEEGTILHTDDGGKRWSTQTSGTREGLTSVSFVSGQEVWTVGSAGTILHTGDGGKTWSAQVSPTRQDLAAVSFADNQDGWAVGSAATIVHTEDGGQTWSAQSSPQGTEDDLTSVASVSKQVGWAVGVRKTILHTKDGGQTWRRLN